MKKLIIATVLASISLSASAAETIRFAAEATYPPFEFIDANNKMQGFDIDLANALCKEMQADCTFTNQAFDSLIPSLKFKRLMPLFRVWTSPQNARNKWHSRSLTTITQRCLSPKR